VRLKGIRWATLLVGVVVVAVAASRFRPAASALTAADVGRLSAVVQAARERGDIPGLALSIVNRSSVLVETGYGVANVTSGRSMSADTLLPLGSTTKAFTSSLLALLIDKHAAFGLQSVTLIPLLRPRRHPSSLTSSCPSPPLIYIHTYR